MGQVQETCFGCRTVLWNNGGIASNMVDVVPVQALQPVLSHEARAISSDNQELKGSL